MSFRTRVSLIAVLVILLVTAGFVASAQVGWPGMWGTGLDLVAPVVISGSDLGFRVESTKDGIALGKIVVRIDGHWVDAQVGSSGIIVSGAR
jgi:hypothetical protein